MRSILALAALVLAAASLSGCGGSSSSVDNRTTTVGQELQDLEAARNKGLLTEDDYQRQREAILNRK
jgi:outer membrane murein-binding lipoprotein Lpp